MNRLSVYGFITAAMFVLLPFATSRHLFHAAVNTKYFLFVSAVLVLAAVVAEAVFNGKKVFNLKERPLLWAGVGLLGLYWVTALLGVFPEKSLYSDIQRSTGVIFLTHVAVLALILSEFFTVRDWSVVRRTIALSTAVYSFCTILGTEGFGFSGRILWSNLDINGYTFGNTTFAGTYLVLALVIALIELVRTPAKTRWWYALLAATTLIFVSPVLFSAGALLQGAVPLGSARASSATAILLMVFFVGYVLLKRFAGEYTKQAYVAWGAVFIVAVMAGVGLLFTPGSVVQEKYIEASTAARIVVWGEGLQAFKDRPVLGWGPENFEQAVQAHMDNRLYADEYLGEIWFDRAHNVVIDTIVNVGVVGAAATLVVVGLFVWVVYRARRQDVIGDGEAALLFALPLAHFLQLQTGFDTVGSFILLGVLGGYGLYLERSLHNEPPQHKRTQVHTKTQYYQVGASVLVGLVLVSVYINYTEFSRQNALFKVFVETKADTRMVLVETATSRLSSFESLRLASGSLVKGVLARIAEGTMSKQLLGSVLKEADLYEERFRQYISAQPHAYRARMNFVYLLSVVRVLGGENKLAEAKAVVQQGYVLSPNNLLTPAMDALLEMYSGNLVAAKKKAEEVVALNPDAPFGKEVLAHIEKQEATFPTISVLRLENL